MFHIDLPLEKECKFFHLAEFYLFVFCRNRTFDRIGKYLHLPFDIHKYIVLSGRIFKPSKHLMFEAAE